MAQNPSPKRDETDDTERERRTTTPPAHDDDTRVAFTSWDAPLIPR